MKLSMFFDKFNMIWGIKEAQCLSAPSTNYFKGI